MDERRTCPSSAPGRGARPGRPGSDPAQAGTVVLVRPLPGVAGEARRTVHLVPVVPGSGDLTAYCGLKIRPESVEVLDRLTGMPCEACLMFAPSRNPRATHPLRW